MYFLSKFIINFLKSIILLFSSYIFTLFSKNKNLDSEILIFSFVDSRSRGNTDTYFGDLIDKIKLEYPHYNISYLFYAYRPYFSNIKNLFEEKNSYLFLFKILRLSDYIWCLKTVFNFYYLIPILPILKINDKQIDLNLLVHVCLIEDISKGLIDNLLIFRAFRRLNKM